MHALTTSAVTRNSHRSPTSGVELFTAYRYHAVFTNSPPEMLEAEKAHRARSSSTPNEPRTADRPAAAGEGQRAVVLVGDDVVDESTALTHDLLSTRPVALREDT